MKTYRRVLIWGAIFGVFALPLGLFLGLQVFPPLADLLLFPVHILGLVVETPFGFMSGPMRLGVFLFSVLCWAGVFVLGAMLCRRLRRS